MDKWLEDNFSFLGHIPKLITSKRGGGSERKGPEFCKPFRENLEAIFFLNMGISRTDSCSFLGDHMKKKVLVSVCVCVCVCFSCFSRRQKRLFLRAVQQILQEKRFFSSSSSSVIQISSSSIPRRRKRQKKRCTVLVPYTQ